jgi:ubiquinol-cytochrome c reductase iron-sulfur subunit
MSHVATLASPSASGPDDPERRVWLLASGAAGAAAVAATAVPLVSSFAPSDRARAAGAAVEVDVSDIPPGGMKTVEWRGKPVWILRRTPEHAGGADRA